MITTVRARPVKRNTIAIVDAFGESHALNIQEYRALDRVGDSDRIRSFTPPKTMLIVAGDEIFIIVELLERPADGDTVTVRFPGPFSDGSGGETCKVGIDQLIHFENMP